MNILHFIDDIQDLSKHVMIIERDDYSGVVITETEVVEYDIVQDEILTDGSITPEHRKIIMDAYNS